MLTDENIKLHWGLWPFSFLYGIGVSFRNKLFDLNLLHSCRFPVPVICIGNLAVGGTGKTPHIEFLIRFLKNRYRVAVLSRGYKRKTSGFIRVSVESSSWVVGDEPLQMKRKFPDITVAVDTDRCRGIETLLAHDEKPEIILLDDAFQHRYVLPSLSILLTDYNRLFYYDRLLPVGRLRESEEGIERADIVVVTRCQEDMKPIEYRIIEENMKLKAHQQLFFSHTIYGDLTPVFPESAPFRSQKELDPEEEMLLIAGIAMPRPFIEEAGRLSSKVLPVTFSDHHAFTRSDFKRMDALFRKYTSPGRMILTTEKDAVRLKGNPDLPESWKEVLYYLPISVKLHNGKGFEEAIARHLLLFNKVI